MKTELLAFKLVWIAINYLLQKDCCAKGKISSKAQVYQEMEVPALTDESVHPIGGHIWP